MTKNDFENIPQALTQCTLKELIFLVVACGLFFVCNVEAFFDLGV